MPQFCTSRKQRGPRINIWVFNPVEDPFHRSQVFGFRIEREQGVGYVRVGFKASPDGVGMELGSESNVAAIGAGGDGR
ncbi:hypothetical protein ACFX13_028165 [Malus domestica]